VSWVWCFSEGTSGGEEDPGPGGPERIIGAICEPFKAKREELLKKGYKGPRLGVLIEMLDRYGGMHQREIGEWMAIDYSAVSVMRKSLSVHLERDRSLSGVITKVKERLQSRQEYRPRSPFRSRSSNLLTILFKSGIKRRNWIPEIDKAEEG